MTVAYAAIHRHLHYKGEDTGLYGLAFVDGRTFLSRVPPALYDRQARRIPCRELLPGSRVNVSFVVEQKINRLQAVQVVDESGQSCPFDPVPDDGRL